MTHTATEAPTQTVAERAYDAFRPLRLRLRFAGALILLVLPLLAAAWAFGSYAAANERSRTDTRLSASLRAAASEFARIVDDRQLQAMQLATTRRVQVALRDRNKEALAQLVQAHPDTHFVTGSRLPATAPGVVRRSIDVLSGTRVVGRVVVDVAFDRAAATRTARAAGLAEQHEIAVAERGGHVVAASVPLSGSLSLPGIQPRTVKVDGTSYRAVAARLAPSTRLGILAPTHAVDAAAVSIRNRILFSGLLVLGAVMVMAYALAPALARARVGQQQRAIAERVLTHVADGVVLLDHQGIVRFWNRAAEMITRLDAHRVLGSSADEAIPGWRAAAPQIPVGEAEGLPGSAASATVPLEIDQRELWLAASGVRFADGTVYTFRDITEDERLDQAKTDFVATVSHELRTPLASVYGAALTLQQRFSALDAPRRDELLQLLADQANRLSSIINELLLASRLAGRLDAGRLELEYERFDADDLARTVVQAAQIHAPPGIEIELSTPPWLPYATGDRDKVGQVLTNLIENAVKYSPGGGRVDLVLEQHDERIRFEVRDQGLGIPRDEHERIFQKFYRLDPNLTRGVGGTGLGLYICRELVRRMGGEVHVTSSLGEGSTFSFDLPATPSVARVPEPIASV